MRSTPILPVAFRAAALLLGLLASPGAVADEPFVVEDVVLGDGTTGCLGLEPSPDMKYLAWTEQTGGKAWICGLDSDTGQLVPESGKGFPIEGISPTGNPQWGEDSSGEFLVTVDRTGRLLVIRPTSPTAATITPLATPSNTTRQFPFPARMPAREHSYIAYEQLDGDGVAGLFWVDLAIPTIENRAVALPGDILPPSLLGLAITIYRWFPGLPVFTYAYLKPPGLKFQIYQLDVSEASPRPVPVTADATDHIDDFPTVLLGSRYLIGSRDRSSTGVLYRQDPASLLVSPVATVTPSGSALADPQWAVSFEPFLWNGRAYSGFQVIDGGDPLDAVPGEIWLTSLLDGAGNVDTTLLRRVHDATPVQRRDPEFFLGTQKAWLLYYGKATGSSLFRIHRADTGLRAAAAPDLPFRWMLPSSARSAGAGGAFYTTHLTIWNAGATDASLLLKFLGHDGDGRSGPEKSFSLGAGKSVTWSDLLGSVFGLSSDYGAVRVSASSISLAVTSQTSTPSSSGGTFGQAVPAFTEGKLIRPGSPRALLAVREDDAFRTNLVLANASEAALEVDVALVAETGATLATRRFPLPPLGMTQVTRVVRDLGVSTNVAGGRLVLSTPTAGGAFAAYAALIDNATNDPRTLLPSP